MFNNPQNSQEVMGAKKKNSLPFMRQNSGFENQPMHQNNSHLHSPKPGNFEGNPQGNSGFYHDKFFGKKNDMQMTNMSERNEDSYNI